MYRRCPEIEDTLCVLPWQYLRILNEADKTHYEMKLSMVYDDKYIFRIFNKKTKHAYCINLREIHHGTPFMMTFIAKGLEWREFTIYVRVMLRIGYTITKEIIHTLENPTYRWVVWMEQRRHDAYAQRGLCRWRAFVERRRYLRRMVWNTWMARAGRPGDGTLYTYWKKAYETHC